MGVCDVVLGAVGAVEDSTDDGEIFGSLLPYGKRIDRGFGLTLEVEPGAAASSVKDPKRIKLLWQHSWDAPIGVMLELEERDTGLYGRGRITTASQVPRAAEALALLRDKVIDELSAGFDHHRYTPRTDDQGNVHVVHHRIKLREISVVTFGAAGRDARVHSVNAHNTGAVEAWRARFAGITIP